ncbi:MAG: hypothetical protein NFW16_19835, partial [Candidatus Accumulibacter sp.]|uniref:hypothetical protein n=1 Tax=Accumulibacter sp. TaxID=2053492 RepID=UPI0025887848
KYARRLITQRDNYLDKHRCWSGSKRASTCRRVAKKRERGHRQWGGQTLRTDQMFTGVRFRWGMSRASAARCYARR